MGDLLVAHEALPESGNFPARVLLDTETRATVAQLTAAAKGRAPNPAAIDEDRLIFWTVEGSSNRLDAYSTWMGTSTLRNFEADAKAGISFQDSHLTRGLPFTLGQSIGARYIGPNANARPEGIAAVEVDFFAERGLDPAIDSFIRKAEIGLTRDVSVGFYLGPDGYYRCALCNRDMFDYSDWKKACHHIPGVKYPIYDANGKPTDERVVATAEVVKGRLAEISSVYDGATPEASILAVKARNLADAGELPRATAALLEQRYRFRLPGMAPAWGVGIDLRVEEGGTRREVEGSRAPSTEDVMPEGTNATPTTEAAPTQEPATTAPATPPAATERATPTAPAPAAAQPAATDPLVDIRAILDEGGVQPDEGDILARLRWLVAERARLAPLADDGKQYREDLVADALAEGVRANGQSFATETYRAILQVAPLATLKRMRDDWKAIGDSQFAGGRRTRDGDEEPLPGPETKPANEQRDTRPNDAFRA